YMISALLHNIRSVHNVGSMFRTADAAGVDRIYISGYTPSPVDRFGRLRKDFSKVSLGAEVQWEFIKDPIELIKKLKKENFVIISLEQNKNSVDYKKVKPENKNLIIVGNEVEGVPEEFLKLSDVIAEIPMQGKKESLNVSVAFGVALFRMLNT